MTKTIADTYIEGTDQALEDMVSTRRLTEAVAQASIPYDNDLSYLEDQDQYRYEGKGDNVSRKTLLQLARADARLHASDSTVRELAGNHQINAYLEGADLEKSNTWGEAIEKTQGSLRERGYSK